ncbi:MAG: RsmB/NOP family class I SAM-dependent RNA methyltransferase, partial [Bdellovibrionales bacterium]|nr:RsmB/NOP family class I SAM-dependent RNA methyltransferase [Bdellovibrionales bacterium]
FEKGHHADRMIDKYMRVNKNWKPDDRSFFAEAVYGIIRHRRYLEFIAESEKLWLVIAAYLVTKKLKPQVVRHEFKNSDAAKVKIRMNMQKPPAFEHSFPDWLYELGLKEFGTEWDALMQSLNNEPQIFLRTNTLKTSADKLIQSLKSDKIIVDKINNSLYLPDCLYLKERKNVFATQAFKKGNFEMQDAGSQFIAPLLDVQIGQQVVDACAGSGGKSLHLAALMQNKGKILAMDIHRFKLQDLKERANRAGATILETQVIDSPKVIQQLENKFDRVLIDSPCSGMGTLRRNPDTKWKLKPEQISTVCALQKDILSRYSKMCKSGGLMVYATCSILKCENEEQVIWFLNTPAGKNWSLRSEHRIWPHIHGFDGFYAAVLKRS